GSPAYDGHSADRDAFCAARPATVTAARRHTFARRIESSCRRDYRISALPVRVSALGRHRPVQLTDLGSAQSGCEVVDVVSAALVRTAGGMCRCASCPIAPMTATTAAPRPHGMPPRA